MSETPICPLLKRGHDIPLLKMSETPIRPLLKRGHDRLLLLFFLCTYFEKRRKTKLLSSIAQRIFLFTAITIDSLEYDYMFSLNFCAAYYGVGLRSLIRRFTKNVFEEDAFVGTSIVSERFELSLRRRFYLLTSPSFQDWSRLSHKKHHVQE